MHALPQTNSELFVMKTSRTTLVAIIKQACRHRESTPLTVVVRTLKAIPEDTSEIVSLYITRLRFVKDI